MEAKLYVGNLSYNTTENDLRDLFTQAGEIQEITLVTDRFTSQPKGFGFVQMVNQVDSRSGGGNRGGSRGGGGRRF